MPDNPDRPAPVRAPRRIVVLATGGTIAAARGSDGALSPARDAAELLAGVPAPPGVRVRAHQLMAVDSAALTPADMNRIAARAVAELRGGADGVVVLHGTDTMEESALVADLALARCGETGPVLFTGAQRGADHTAPDGPGNLRLALTAAAAGGAPRGSAEPPPVRIAFAGRLLPVWGTRKTHTTDLHGFDAWPDAPAASAARVRALSVLRGLWDGSAEPPPGPPPRVDIVALHPGADGTAVRALRGAGARGLVVEAMGAGNAAPGMVAPLAEAVEAGVPVVVTTRVPHGAARADYGGGGGGADLAAAGAVLSPVLRAGQARVLLAALLDAGAGPAAVVRAFGP